MNRFDIQESYRRILLEALQGNDMKSPIELVDFVFKKQAPLDAVVNALLNVLVTWFMLSNSPPCQ